jgi:hypothetical protein
MPQTGFDPAIPAGERPQTYALGRAATKFGIDPRTAHSVASRYPNPLIIIRYALTLSGILYMNSKVPHRCCCLYLSTNQQYLLNYRIYYSSSTQHILHRYLQVFVSQGPLAISYSKATYLLFRTLQITALKIAGFTQEYFHDLPSVCISATLVAVPRHQFRASAILLLFEGNSDVRFASALKCKNVHNSFYKSLSATQLRARPLRWFQNCNKSGKRSVTSSTFLTINTT